MQSAQCKIRVLYAPAVMTGHTCGASIDLRQGKECSHRGRDLELEKYDRVTEKIRL